MTKKLPRVNDRPNDPCAVFGSREHRFMCMAEDLNFEKPSKGEIMVDKVPCPNRALLNSFEDIFAFLNEEERKMQGSTQVLSAGIYTLRRLLEYYKKCIDKCESMGSDLQRVLDRRQTALSMHKDDRTISLQLGDLGALFLLYSECCTATREAQIEFNKKCVEFKYPDLQFRSS